MLGSVCVYFEAEAVLIAVGICAGVTLGLTLFSFQVSTRFWVFVISDKFFAIK